MYANNSYNVTNTFNNQSSGETALNISQLIPAIAPLASLALPIAGHMARHVGDSAAQKLRGYLQPAATGETTTDSLSKDAVPFTGYTNILLNLLPADMSEHGVRAIAFDIDPITSKFEDQKQGLMFYIQKDQMGSYSASAQYLESFLQKSFSIDASAAAKIVANATDAANEKAVYPLVISLQEGSHPVVNTTTKAYDSLGASIDPQQRYSISTVDIKQVRPAGLTDPNVLFKAPWQIAGEFIVSANSQALRLCPSLFPSLSPTVTPTNIATGTPSQSPDPTPTFSASSTASPTQVLPDSSQSSPLKKILAITLPIATGIAAGIAGWCNRKRLSRCFRNCFRNDTVSAVPSSPLTPPISEGTQEMTVVERKPAVAQGNNPPSFGNQSTAAHSSPVRIGGAHAATHAATRSLQP